MGTTTRTIGIRMGSALTLTAIAAVCAPVGVRGQGPDRFEAPLSLESGRLVVPVTAENGHTLDFMLSTGNGVTVLAESVAAHLGDSPSLMVGEVAIDADDAYEIADEDLVVDGRQFHGIVAANTLNQFDILIDLPNERLVLQSIGPRVEWAGTDLSDPIRLRIYHGIVIGLDVTLNGRTYGAMLDTGSSPVLINAAAAAALGIDREGEASLQLGGVTIPNAAVHVSDTPIFERWDPDGNGFVIVGGSLARDCAISISWVHQEMRMCSR